MEVVKQSPLTTEEDIIIRATTLPLEKTRIVPEILKTEILKVETVEAILVPPPGVLQVEVFESEAGVDYPDPEFSTPRAISSKPVFAGTVQEEKFAPEEVADKLMIKLESETAACRRGKSLLTSPSKKVSAHDMVDAAERGVLLSSGSGSATPPRNNPRHKPGK